MGAYTLIGVDWSWQVDPVETPFELNPSSFPGAFGGEVVVSGVLRDAMGVWNNEGAAGVTVRDGGLTTDLSWGVFDDRNVLQYHASTTDPGAVAIAQSWDDGVNLVECDIRFFGANGMGVIDWSTNPAGAGPDEIDLAHVAIHELGHCLGLDHSDVPGAVMTPFAEPGTGEERRHLASDDVEGLQAMYGATGDLPPVLALQSGFFWDDLTPPANGDGDGRIEAGERLGVAFTVENIGDGPATGVEAELRSFDPELSVVNPVVPLGTLLAGATDEQSIPFEVVVSSSCNRDFEADVRLTYSDAQGRVWPTDLLVQVNCAGSGPSDADNDGFPAPQDCDDSNPAVFPGAVERCNGVDDDCDGAIDESAVDRARYYRDVDGDSWGNAANSTLACAAPVGFVARRGDCNDADAAVNPGAVEACNGRDDNCNGVVDDTGDAGTWYPDSDGDGYGITAAAVTSCAAPPGHVATGGDCDDTRATAFPGAIERCNGRDDDCDGAIDEVGAVGGSTWFADADADGFGDPAASVAACAAPPGHVADNTDCDDTTATRSPAAIELCNDLDDDCDGLIDESGTNSRQWYRDLDGDGWGNAANARSACAQPVGFVARRGDCNDARADIFPGAPEQCNGRDEDCDGRVDNGLETFPWYRDVDGDSFGGIGDVVLACAAPPGRIAVGGDCDDTNGAVSPAGVEACNGRDDDCDGQVDEPGATGATAFYNDADADGFGDVGALVVACAAPPGHVAAGTDCDDADAAVFPGANERCNGADDDCDGQVDEGLSGAPWFADADGDGFGDATRSVNACAAPTGFVGDNTDCADADARVFPGAPETCDGADQDCDGAVDEDPVDAPLWYADADGDSFGAAADAIASCAPIPGRVRGALDCDDQNPAVGPGLPEICNGLDDDCDGRVDGPGAGGGSVWYFDLDGDGFGSAPAVACAAPDGYVAVAGDCDDSDPAVRPGAVERCNRRDDDCDGVADGPDAVDPSVWYADEDGDGFGQDGLTAIGCAPPFGYGARGGDCDDRSRLVFPDAPEFCNGVDDDCDGDVDEDAGETWFVDADGDGFGDAAGLVVACAPPAGAVANALDCADADSAAFPGAPEWCNGVDDDCDGEIDGPDPLDGELWYPDQDGDGWGDDDALGRRACAPPDAHVPSAGDCDDGAFEVSPDRPERCNGLDDDCDGEIDEDVEGQTGWVDADGDGFGDPNAPVNVCAPAPGVAVEAGDCDDNDPGINPAQTDLPDDGVDQDCDGADAVAEDVPDSGTYSGRGACGCAVASPAGARGGFGFAGFGLLLFWRRRG